MIILPKLISKLQKLSKPAALIYPIIIIASIPLLLAINTFWNLRSFNRDANFLIRHQAVSIADILKPQIIESVQNEEKLDVIFTDLVESSEDIIAATLLKKEGEKLVVVASSTTHDEASQTTELDLNQFAIGLDQSFAGLTYDPQLEQKVWNVVVPIKTSDSVDHLLSIKLSTQTVNTILSRTSRDSIVILVILIAITIILLVNHFVFYQKAQKAQQLTELDKLKDKFISMAAHELRAPMTALTGYLELLMQKVSEEELTKIREDLTILNGISQDLHALIDDLLDVSRIEQGRLKIMLERANVGDIIEKVVNTMHPTAEQKGIKLSYNTSQLPEIKTDPGRLQQVMTNLTSNAIKYTLQGEVAISTSIKNKYIEITVNDTGIGIPADQMDKLFSKFHRVKDKKTYEERGTGLGLWITKQFVELLGGKIFVESIYGTGTRFTFTLPIRTG